MKTRQPLAFLSYVRTDDDHDGGRITRFRERLEGEVRMQTGRAFPIFQDRNDLAWGQNWDERIKRSLADVTFLIPIITPSFFESPACRSEFEIFQLKELALGLNRLILPIYYVSSDKIDSPSDGADQMVKTLLERRYTDWRSFRFKKFDDEDVSIAFSLLATTIKSSISELQGIMEVESSPSITGGDLFGEVPPPEVAQTPRPSIARARARPRLPSIPTRASEDVGSATSDDIAVVEIRPRGKADPKRMAEARRPKYFAYTKMYDEVIDARDLADSDALVRLFETLNKYIEDIRSSQSSDISAAEQLLSSEDLHGLDVLLAIDSSGSMRGQPINFTAAWMAIILELLEKHGARTEVIGYTTRAWKGGMSKSLWIKDGRPERPGRLNDLRHILLKRESQSTSEAILNLSVMLKDGILKENIDGESLIWCHDRINSMTGKRKVILLISDGAPVDDATLEQNEDRILMDHAVRVARWINSETQIKLRVVDIGSPGNNTYEGMRSQSSLEGIGLNVVRSIVLAAK